MSEEDSGMWDFLAEMVLYERAFLKASESDLPSIFDASPDLLPKAIRTIADEHDLDVYQVTALRDVYDALTNGRGGFRLKLVRAKSGKPVSREASDAQARLDDATLYLVEALTKKNGVLKAAIADVMRVGKVSRKTVFERMKRAKFRRKEKTVRQFARKVATESRQIDE